MKLKFLGLGLVVLAGILSGYFYDALPQQIPMHWNIRGEVDNYENKDWAVWFVPVLTGLMWMLFQVLPKYDPKKNNYPKFEREWQIMQLLIIGFMVYVHGVTLYISLNPAIQMLPFMFSGLGIMFAVIGLLLPRVKQNYFVGIKTPWTLSDEKIWNKTHKFGGRCFLISGLVFLVQAMFGVFDPGWMMVVIFAALLLPIGYSLGLYKGWGQS